MPVLAIVRRGDGSHPGKDIYDPLISQLPVALVRGRNEIDEQGSGLQPVDLVIPFRVGLRLGQVVQVHEVLFGTTWFGKIEGLTHSRDLSGLITSLQVKRPTDFTVAQEA